VVSGARFFAHHPARYGLVLVGAVLVAVLPPVYSVALIAVAALVLVLLAQPYVSLCALAFAVPFEQVRSFTAGGVNITITNLIVMCLFLAWIGRGISAGTPQLGPAPWRAVLLVYGAVLIVSVSQAVNYVDSLKELLKWGQLLFVYLAGVSIVRTRAQMRTLLLMLFLAVLAEAVVGVGQTLLHAGPSSFARGAILRSAGTFDQPNPFAGYLNMTLPLAVACLVEGVFSRRLMWLVTIVTGTGVLVSVSRGAWTATLAALVVIGFVTSPHARALVGVVAAGLVGLICLVLIGVVPSTVTQPLAEQFGVANVDIANPTPDNWAVAERLAHMEAGLGMFVDHPVFGVGIGNYPAVYSKYQAPGPWGPDLGHAHNYYINIAAEAGVIGFAAWILLLTSALVICARSYRRAPDALGRAIALGGAGVITAFAVHQFFDDLLVHSMEVQIALVMVLVSLAGYGVGRTAVEPEVGT